MKRLMITAAFIAGLVSFGYSQDKPERTPAERGRSERPRIDGMKSERSRVMPPKRSPEQRAQMATDALEKRLSLTADQKAKVYALNLERAEKMEKTMKAQQEFRKAQLQKQKALMEDSDKKLTKILTEEQQKSYQEMKKQSRERMKSRRGPGAPGNRMK
jgi:protein CpxP